MKSFELINRGYNNVFRPNELSLGIVIPIENYDLGPIPTMKGHAERVHLVEKLGFAALWVRDIPFNVPAFGDSGQMFDPFTYLGFLAAQTSEIALGIASVALPLRHPLHVAKSAASIDQLSEGRMILGVASGDRPQEYPAMNIEFDKRGELFAESFRYIRQMQHSFPSIDTGQYGFSDGQLDMLPKATGPKLPLMMTGSSRQTLEWNAKNADGWMNYPRNLYLMKNTIHEYREEVSRFADHDRPFMHPLYLDLHEDDDFRPQPIHLGFRLGVNPLVEYLHQSREIGVNHIALNLRFNKPDMLETLHRLADKVLPHFHHSTQTELTS